MLVLQGCLRRPTVIKDLSSVASLAEARSHAVSVGSVSHSFRLLPVGPWILSDSAVLEMLTEWRAAGSQGFFSHFPPSVAGMTEFLRQRYVDTETAVLFIVEDRSGVMLGHLGLKGIRAREAEVDNVLSGRVRPGRGPMEPALRTVMAWARRSLGVERLTLEVRSDNQRALSLYARCGFTVVHSSHLRQTQVDQLTTYHDCAPAESDVSFSRLRMCWTDPSTP